MAMGEQGFGGGGYSGWRRLPTSGNGYRGLASVWPIVTLGLLVAGWVTFLLATGYTARSVERRGPAPDVVDALGRDAYISRHTLAYYSVVMLLDVLGDGVAGGAEPLRLAEGPQGAGRRADCADGSVARLGLAGQLGNGVLTAPEGTPQQTRHPTCNPACHSGASPETAGAIKCADGRLNVQGRFVVQS